VGGGRSYGLKRNVAQKIRPGMLSTEKNRKRLETIVGGTSKRTHTKRGGRGDRLWPKRDFIRRNRSATIGSGLKKKFKKSACRRGYVKTTCGGKTRDKKKNALKPLLTCGSRAQRATERTAQRWRRSVNPPKGASLF